MVLGLRTPGVLSSILGIFFLGYNALMSTVRDRSSKKGESPIRQTGDLVHDVLADMFRRLKAAPGLEKEVLLALEQLSREGELKNPEAVQTVLARRR